MTQRITDSSYLRVCGAAILKEYGRAADRPMVSLVHAPRAPTGQLVSVLIPIVSQSDLGEGFGRFMPGVERARREDEAGDHAERCLFSTIPRDRPDQCTETAASAVHPPAEIRHSSFSSHSTRSHAAAQPTAPGRFLSSCRRSDRFVRWWIDARRFAPGNLAGPSQDGNDGQASATTAGITHSPLCPSPGAGGPGAAAAARSSPITSASCRSSSTSSTAGSPTSSSRTWTATRSSDIIVTNNGRSRIDLLLSTKKPDDDKAARPFRKDANELEYDRRMRLVSIPVNKEVVSIDTGDFNGDGKPDLVFYGTPGRGGHPFQRGTGPVRQPQEDQHRRRGSKTGRARRGRPGPGRARRPGAAWRRRN